MKASACCKHYVANEMESTTQADGEHYDRQHVESWMSTRKDDGKGMMKVHVFLVLKCFQMVREEVRIWKFGRGKR